MGQATNVFLETHSELDEASTSDLRAVAAQASNAPIRISIHHELADIESDWRAFEQRADCTAFQAFEWLSVWQRRIGSQSGVRPAVVAGRDAAAVPRTLDVTVCSR